MKVGRKCIKRYFSFVLEKDSAWQGLQENEDSRESPIIYPNPLGESLNLQFTGRRMKINSGSICDISGRVVKIIPTMESADGKYLIDVSNLESGIYLLELLSNRGARFVNRFVKE